jgi:hypothetical protein
MVRATKSVKAYTVDYFCLDNGYAAFDPADRDNSVQFGRVSSRNRYAFIYGGRGGMGVNIRDRKSS